MPNGSHLNGVANGGKSGAMTPVSRPGHVRQETLKDLGKIEDKVFASDGVLTLEMAERMLKWHAESIGRVVELSASGDVSVSAMSC